MIAALTAADVAPEQMLGRNSESGLTRPLCPYPKAAKHDGSGDP